MDVAITVAAELTKDDLVVVLLPDSGRGYLSKIFNDQWMMEYGFLIEEGPKIQDVIEYKKNAVPTLFTFNLMTQ